MNQPRRAPALPEFIALMAIMSSLMALSIDAILPALPQIGQDLAVTRVNDNQLIISFLFLGMAGGLLIYGPLSDSFGRKPPLYLGLGLFAVGCLVSIFSHSLTVMLVGRLIQGLGLAAPRVVSQALIRDQFQGQEMARVMSFVMTVFILVPALAPSLGQVILLWFPWQGIFVMYLLLGLMVLIWFALRQPETLRPEARRPYAPKKVLVGVVEVCRNRQSMGPTAAMGIVFGAFLGYLASSPQIFEGIYQRGEDFPKYFGLLALFFGVASLVNARLVRSFGLNSLAKRALAVLVVDSVGFFALNLTSGGRPPFWWFMAFMAVAFFCIAVLFGNLNAMAMEPLGHIAGVGAAVVGTISTLISAGLGALIGQLYDETLLPMSVGFILFGLISYAVLAWSERHQRRLKAMAPGPEAVE